YEDMDVKRNPDPVYLQNEYELLFMLFGLMPRNNAGTIIWNKLNPMLGRKGVATQHEYVIFKSNFNNSIYAKSENLDKLKEYAAKAIQDNNGVNDIARAVYKQMLNDDDTLTGGECAYNLIDDDRNIYRLVAMGAPEKRLDEKYYIPLIHPITKKPCPVPSNGWSRRPETMADMIAAGRIVFGKDETTQPQKKVVLSEESTKQIASVISDGKSGKAFLDSLGTEFPYAHPVSLYEVLISANNPTLILDYFAGSGTTGHAVLNLNRADNGTRKYILVEMAEYFHTVTLPRMKKVVYSADWKAGKPQNRGTGVSHIMKYVALESYEDALSNIELDDERHTLFSHFGEEYLLHYMFDYEAKDCMLSLSAFTAPFKYQLRINENNETKDKVVDICETFNFLLGLSVIRQSATIRFRAVADPNGGYEGAVKLELDDNGEYVFKHIEGRTPDGKRALVIWRTVTQDLLQSNAALDAYFGKHRINPADREFDVIYVNGDNNLENLRLDDETWKVQRIEPVFKEKMFEEAE
ncbi:MAG: site-specific DNA-methyltransferase, partial [Clostridia bacterium]|nr:site-specific DNA-methyltransferase [Clostridia bacterium]